MAEPLAEPPLVALFGATALGKTEVAIALAERLDAEIVVADSMQVYAGLPIVTNQPDEAQRARARHHLVGFVPPQQEYTVAEYAREAHVLIDRLRAAGRPVIVEGGSGLYLRAALGDLDFAARSDPEVLRELEARWAQDPEGVVDELRGLDPATSERIDTANPRRVVRALETVRSLGRPLSSADRDRLWRPAERYPHHLVALLPDAGRDALRCRIDERVDWMLAGGAPAEVAAARRAGPFSRTAMQAIGVKELLAYQDGAITLSAAGAAMKTRTHALVRRQLTWMRKLPGATCLATSAGQEATVAAILDLVEPGAW
jgi:tRNA dimethylallyltransferase